MAEIISTWIRSRLGVIVDLTAPSIGNCCRDGTFYAKLLHSYAVINESQLNTIIHTSDPALARVNLRHLQVWLRFIGVNCDREAIEDISNAKGTAAFHLLYKIYLCLENKDRLHFITLEKERENYVPASTKFDVKVVPEEPEFDETLPEHPLLKLLEINTQLSGSHKEDVRKMLTNYLRERHSSSRASEILTDNEESDDGLTTKNKSVGRKMDKKEVRKNAKRKMMKELDDFAEKHANVSRSKPEEPYEVHGRPEAAKQYIEELKARRKRESEIDQRNKEIQNRVMKYFWDKAEQDQENHFDKIIAGVVLRQSNYEKKMTTKLLEIRRQKHRIAANRQMVNEMMFTAREDHMRLVEESKREMKALDDEELEDDAQRFNELQNRLQHEKEEKMKNEARKTAKDIVDDVVNLVIYSVDSEIPRGLWNEWKSSFIKGFQIFPCKIDSKNTLESKPEVMSEHLQENALIDKDLCDYIDINAPWNEFVPEIDEESKEFIELGSIVLGYVVHKLLQEFPQEFLRPKLPEVKVRAILLGVPDPQHYSTLQDLLKYKKISLIRMEDAINYCLQCYKEEKRHENSVEELKLETHSESSIQSPLEFSKSTDKSKKIVNKKTQTPRVIPFDDMHPILSDSAYIGEWIHRFFIKGEPISDELIGKIIFEYLKSFDNIKGWVLINYPDTYRQLAFLEMTLSGKPLSNVNKMFSFNEDDTQVYEFEPQIKFRDSGESVCRVSKLLSNPLMESDGKYNSCLTAYIRMIEKPTEVEVNAEELFEVRAEDVTRIDEFYRDQGIAQVVYYDECDNKTLKRVARLVIGDVRVPRKSSEEMFGSEEIRNSSVKSLSVESSQSQECKVKPGEINWTWVDLPLSFEVKKGLVLLWKNCESTYLDGLKDILFLKRLNLTAVIPYKDFVYNRVIQSCKDSSGKQELVRKFKEAFNEVIEAGIDKIGKSKLRGNVEELQMELWEICDTKRLKADEERKKIVLDDWTSKQIIVLINIYVRIMHIEIDRFVDTLQFLRSYYLMMLQRSLGDNIFKKIKFVGSGGAKKKFPKLPDINDAALKKEIHTLMLGTSDNLVEKVTDHCLQIIKPTIDYAQSTVEDLSNSAVEDLKKERSFKSKRRSSEVKVRRKPEKLSDVSMKTKKVKLGSKKKKLFLEWEYALMCEINRIKIRMQILISAVKADIEFLLVNVKRGFSVAGQLINDRYKIEIDNVNDLVKLFEEAIENDHIIREEINLVDDCFVIPKDIKIVELSVSDEEIDDKFRIEQLCYLKDVFQSVEPCGIISKVSFVYILQDLVSCEEENGEEQEEDELKEGECIISSLPTAWFKLTPQKIKELVDELFEDDMVDWREFIIYALDINLSQDAMLDALDTFKHKDHDKDQVISRKEFFSVHLWPFNLENEQEKVVKEEMSDVENSSKASDDLNTSQNEETKQTKGEVDTEEDNEEEIGRLYLIKLFVCDMFSNDDNVNYMEILLAFCRDDEPIYGFGKALSIFLGQKICMDYDEGEKYVASIEKQHSQNDVKRKAKRVSKRFVDDLIDCIVETFDKDSIKLDGSVDITIDNAEPLILYEENMQLLSPSDEEDLKLSKSDEEDLQLSKSDEEDLGLRKIDEEDLLLYYNENFYDEQCHDIVYFHAGGRQARRKSTRKIVYWISIDLCETVLTLLLPQAIIENVEASTGVSLKENLRVVSNELRCKGTKINRKFVLAHRFIRHDLITQMLESTNKFTFKNLSSILKKIIKAK